MKGQQGGSAFNADIGTELPPGIELRSVPDELAARVPQTKDYSYAVTHDRVLLVGTSHVVAGVFAAADVPVSQGRLVTRLRAQPAGALTKMPTRRKIPQRLPRPDLGRGRLQLAARRAFLSGAVVSTGD